MKSPFMQWLLHDTKVTMSYQADLLVFLRRHADKLPDDLSGPAEMKRHVIDHMGDFPGRPRLGGWGNYLPGYHTLAGRWRSHVSRQKRVGASK